ncbi:uncharacterized protein [Arachis hypogaea]|uniref:uncharacterized protein n=1 Tax=Arachis hypogaea TaxID=3818 RepID=UPI003B2148DA
MTAPIMVRMPSCYSALMGFLPFRVGFGPLLEKEGGGSLTASLSATAIAGERPPPTTSQPPPPSSQRSPSTAPTQDLLADRAAQHCSTQPAPSAQQVGTTLASRTHHHPQSLATRKSHPAGQDQPLTQDHPADTEHRIKSDMEPEPPSQIFEMISSFFKIILVQCLSPQCRVRN